MRQCRRRRVARQHRQFPSAPSQQRAADVSATPSTEGVLLACSPSRKVGELGQLVHGCGQTQELVLDNGNDWTERFSTRGCTNEGFGFTSLSRRSRLSTR